MYVHTGLDFARLTDLFDKFKVVFRLRYYLGLNFFKVILVWKYNAMKFFNKYVLPITLLFFWNCNKVSVVDNLSKITFEIIFDANDEFDWPESLYVEEIIYLKTDVDYLVTSIDKVYISQKSRIIAILDRKQLKVFLFDSDGTSIGVLNESGEGPDQYLDASDFFIDHLAGIIEILDYKKIKSYRLEDFSYLNTFDLSDINSDQNFRYFTKIDEVYYLWTNIPPYQNQISTDDRHLFHLIKKDGDIIEYFIRKDFGILGDQRIYPAGEFGHFNLSPTIGKNLIYGFTKNGIYEKYNFPFKENNLPKNLLENFYGNEIEVINSPYNKFISNIRETKDHLYFHFIGDERKVYHSLFDRNKKEFVSIGSSKALFPNIIFSDKDYFYSYISPEFLLRFQNQGYNTSDHPILKHLDLKRFDKYDNPIIIKFKF